MVLSWTTVLRVGTNSAENATMREDILVENAANMLKTRRLSDGILLGVQRLSLGTYGSTDWLGLRNTPEHFTIRPAKGKDNEAPAFPYYFLKESNLQHWCQHIHSGPLVLPFFLSCNKTVVDHLHFSHR